LTVATLGLTTEIARNLVAKAVLGKISYVPAVLKAMQSSKPFWARLEGEGETIEGEYLQLVISNGRTHAGPFLASPDATITDGMMDIYAVKPMGVGGIIGASVLALSGNHTKVEEIDAMKANRVVVETNPKLSVILDGEESWFDEMVFELNPAAIRAIVGPSCRLPQNRISTMSWD
jgi:diacylglycerol kinase family enzyme